MKTVENTFNTEDVFHYVDTDANGQPVDCIDECFGCAVERVAKYLNEREDVRALGENIHDLNGGEDAGGQTLWVDDIALLVRAAIEAAQ